MNSAVQNHSIEINNATIEWNLAEGRVDFFGIPSVLFWSNPSLLRMLEPLVHEVGAPLYRLLVAYHSSRGTDEDYRSMITSMGSSFAEGFLAWGYAVSAAGWGCIELPVFDIATKQARVIVRNPWELEMQRGAEIKWGCPFLQGKIIGIFSHALGVNCWADEEAIRVDASTSSVEFHIYPSNKTIATEIDQLRNEQKKKEQQRLADDIEQKTQALRAQEERIRAQEFALQQQAAMISELSTPLIPLTDKVVLMPLIGQIDSFRAQKVIETLLHGVATHHAEVAIMDITGLSIVDTAIANALIDAARAVRLLGTMVVLTGIRPEVAQTLVGLGLDLQHLITRSSLQSGVAYAMAQQANGRPW